MAKYRARGGGFAMLSVGYILAIIGIAMTIASIVLTVQTDRTDEVNTPKKDKANGIIGGIGVAIGIIGAIIIVFFSTEMM